MNAQLKKGVLELIVLESVRQKDMYGYEMIEELEKRSEYVFSLKAGTMYPLLHAMESKKHLVSYEKEAQGKMRRYYTITKQGRAELLKKKEAWETYSKAVGQVIGGALYGNA